MENKEIEKRIDGFVDMRKTLWNAFFLLTAGLSSLILNLNNNIKLGLFIVGFIIWFIIIITISKINSELEVLYNKLKD
jgi:hypothetical protein